MTFCRTLTFFISMVLLCSACGKKPALQDANATFDVSPVSASNFQYTSVSTESKTPTQISFTAKACFKDIARVQPVLEQAFLISGGTDTHKVVSNTDGCVFWTDSLEFNYYS